MSFWYANWIENNNLITLLNLANQNVMNPNAKQSDFIEQDAKWNIPKLVQTLNDHQVIRKIQGIALTFHSTNDSLLRA